MPDLRVSVDPIAALLQIVPRRALVALESLVLEGFLDRTREGDYVRASANRPL